MTGSAALRATLAACLALAACSEPPSSPTTSNPAPSPAASTPTDAAANTAAATDTKNAGPYEVRYYVLDASCPYCRDLRREIEGDPNHPSEIEPIAKMYAGKVRFVFKPGFNENNDPNPEMEPYGFGGAAHGFAGLAPDGKVAFTSPGHHQTRGELIEMIDKMLQ